MRKAVVVLPRIVLATALLILFMNAPATVAHAAPGNALVIHMVATFGADVNGELSTTNDFVELRNSGASVNVGGYQVRLYNGAGTLMQTITIPAGTILAPGSFWTLGHVAGYYRPCRGPFADQGFTADLPVRGSVQVVDAVGNVVDTLGFQGGSGPYETARAVQQTRVDYAATRILSDTDNNLLDFPQVQQSC